MIIVPLPKLGADEIAYINPTSGLQGVSRDPNSCIVTKLMFSSSHGLDSIACDIMQIKLFYPVY